MTTCTCTRYKIGAQYENGHPVCLYCGKPNTNKAATFGASTPQRRRGSSKWNSDPTEATMRGAITELRERVGPRIKREHMEREVWKHSVGAKSQKKFGQLQQAGREEIQKIMDPNNSKYFKVRQRKPGEEPGKATAKQSRGGTT